ncbi:hypothetical protein B0H19DRAFT_1247007 [Mycena capillaripes]|nr:hypothetical protein B0H19DRAFT_1247007 [Mycena capillaripes]
MAEKTSLSKGFLPESSEPIATLSTLSLPTLNLSAPTLPTFNSAPAPPTFYSAPTLPTFNSAPTPPTFYSTPTLPTFHAPAGSGSVSAAPSLSLAIFNNPSSGFPDTASSFLPPLTLPSSIAVPTFHTVLTSKNSDPTGVSGSATLALPPFNNPSHTSGTFTLALPTPDSLSQSGFSSLQSAEFPAPVSSVSTAYDPVSTVAFSRLQSSFSAIGVSSNILTAEVFLYGAYLVMFGFYLNVLRSHGVANNRGLTFATILLFVFCTAHCALQIATSTLYNQLESTSVGDSESVFNRTFTDYSAVAIATDAVYVTSNVIADSIFILRCYAIWNFQLKIIVFPILLTLAVAGVGYTNAFWPLHTPNSLRSANLVVAEFSFKLFKISILLSIFTTMILMVLTGRIWWIGRTARALLGRTIISKYHTACAMILESGAIYCASAIAFTTIGFTLDPIYSTTGAVLGQLVGIAPTIIAVRVGLGRSVGSVKSLGVVTAQSASCASLLQSKGVRNQNEAATEDAHGSSGHRTTNTMSTRSLERPGTVLCIRSDA